MRLVGFAVLVAACGGTHHTLPDGPSRDGDGVADGNSDAREADADVDAASIDATVGLDGAVDAFAAIDVAVVHDAPAGPITGGPCLSGAVGAAAYRIRWANAGGQAQVVYEVDGLPDHSRDKAGAYGYQIGFTPQWVDPFLGEGGLQLDGSDFVDLEMSTVGVSQITSATLAIYGRSFAVSTNGSFNWQTFDGVGQTPTDFVSNVPPYAWYAADMTTEIHGGDSGVLIRIKAGPSSGALVVNRIELCLQAQ